MIKNNLYNVIKELNLISSADIPNVTSTQLSIARSGTAYYLFNLPEVQELKISNYQLTEHHISVYKEHEEGFSKSQYHYTAIFENRMGIKYRLHVFFDAQDKLVDNPAFAKLVDEDENIYEPVSAGEEKNEFIDLACLYTSDWASYVRNQQSKMAEKLAKECAVLEKATSDLSINLELNKEPYIASLEQQIEKLRKLSLFVTNPRPLLETAFFLNQIRDSLIPDEDISDEQLIVGLNRSKETLPPMVEPTKETAPSTETGNGKLPSTPQPQAALEVKRSLLQDFGSAYNDVLALDEDISEEQLIVGLNRSKETLPPMVEPTKETAPSTETGNGKLPSTPQPQAALEVKRSLLQDFGSAYNDVLALDEDISEEQLIASLNRLFLLVNTKESDLRLGLCKASTAYLQELQALNAKMLASASKVLKRLLIMGEYSKAEQLKDFYSFLPMNDMVHLALSRNQGPLFEFLLNNEITTTGYKNFTINDQKYSSLMEYCFQNTNHKTSKAAIFEVLVQQDPFSLLAQDNEGLPFIGTLLLQENHPLRKVLEQNLDLTMRNHEFLKRFKQRLLLISSKPNCSADLHEKISCLLDESRNKQTELKHYTDLTGTWFPKTQAQLNREVTKVVGESLVKRLQDDPEICLWNRELEMKLKVLLQKLPRQEKEKYSRQVKINLETIRKRIASFSNPNAEDIFDLTKTQVLEQQQYAIKIIDLREKLFTVQKKLAKKPSKQNQLLTQQTKIINEINQLSAKIMNTEETVASELEPAIKLLKKLENMFSYFANSNDNNSITPDNIFEYFNQLKLAEESPTKPDSSPRVNPY